MKKKNPWWFGPLRRGEITVLEAAVDVAEADGGLTHGPLIPYGSGQVEAAGDFWGVYLQLVAVQWGKAS